MVSDYLKQFGNTLLLASALTMFNLLTLSIIHISARFALSLRWQEKIRSAASAVTVASTSAVFAAFFFGAAYSSFDEPESRLFPVAVGILPTLLVCIAMFGEARRVTQELNSSSDLYTWIPGGDEEDRRFRIKSLSVTACRTNFAPDIVWLSNVQILTTLSLAIGNSPSPNFAKAALIMATSVPLVLAARGLSKITISTLNPSSELVEGCVRSITQMSLRESIQKRRRAPPSRMTVSRWRGEQHEIAASVSRSLVRSLNGLRQKIPQNLFAPIDTTFRKVAYRAQELSIEHPDEREYYAVLYCATLALVANDNLSTTERQAKELVRNQCDEQAVFGLPSRFTTFLAKLDGLFERYQRPILAMLTSVAIVILIASGKSGEVISFVLDLVSRTE